MRKKIFQPRPKESRIKVSLKKKIYTFGKLLSITTICEAHSGLFFYFKYIGIYYVYKHTHIQRSVCTCVNVNIARED